MRLLLTGASGLLGSYVLRQLHRGIDITSGRKLVMWAGSPEPAGRLWRAGPLEVLLSHQSDILLACSGPSRPVMSSDALRSLDLTNAGQVTSLLDSFQPDVVIHCAALARITDCWQDPARAFLVNSQATAHLAREALRCGFRLVVVSTDLVFDGSSAPYRETDLPNPGSIYAQSKRQAELAALQVPHAVVVRLSLLFGPSLGDKPGFFDQQIAALRQSQPLTLFADEWRTPLALSTAAQGLLRVARSPLTGIVHLGGPERMSRLDMGQRLATCFGIAKPLLVSALRGAGNEPRPRDVALDSSHFQQLFPEFHFPGFEESLRDMGLC